MTDAENYTYSAPVAQLLILGKPDISSKEENWLDYLGRGLNAEHIPDLIRMATDEQLNNADSESLEVWAPVHAWRALGQLRAEAAIEPLLELLREDEESGEMNDWAIEELPEVYGMIGPAALPVLVAFIV